MRTTSKCSETNSCRQARYKRARKYCKAEYNYHVKVKKVVIELSIGEKIRNLRKEKNITQRQLANSTNFSHSYIGDLETGRTNPSLKSLEMIADYFNVDMDYFLQKKCCYEKILEGDESFCNNQGKHCMDCPIRKIARSHKKKQTKK